MPDLSVKAAGKSICGKRAVNQDALYISCRSDSGGRLIALAAVADGIGGEKGGEVAGREAIGDLYVLFDNKEIVSVDFLHRALEKHFRDVRFRLKDVAAQESGLSRMGTTLVVFALLADGEVIVANIGDSRAYHVQKNKLRQLTWDHTIKAEALRNGEKIDGNIGGLMENLTRSLSVDDHGEEADFFSWNIFSEGAGKQIFLLCSDGLYKFVDDEAICTTVYQQSSLEASVSALTELALKKGSSDNISVCLVEVDVLGGAPVKRQESRHFQETGKRRLSSVLLPVICLLMVFLVIILFAYLL